MSVIHILIKYDDMSVDLTEHSLVSEKFELIDSISSGSEFKFGGCESKCVKFTAFNKNYLDLQNLKGRHFNLTYRGVNYGRFIVDSVAVSDSRNTVDVVAYDYMYTMMNMDMTALFYRFIKTPYPYRPESEWPQFKFKSHLSHLFNNDKYWNPCLVTLDCSYENVTLPMDDVYFPAVKTDSNKDTISVGEFLKYYCEVNGVLGYMLANESGDMLRFKKITNGTLDYIYPSSSLYPSATLYPYEQMNVDKNEYYNFTFENYTSKPIKCFVLKGSDEYYTQRVSAVSDVSDSNYYVLDNAIVKYCHTMTINGITVTPQYDILDALTSSSGYKPFSYTPIKKLEIPHNPDIKVGDSLRVYSLWDEAIDTVVLSKTTKGIFAPRDIIESKGIEVYTTPHSNTTS